MRNTKEEEEEEILRRKEEELDDWHNENAERMNELAELEACRGGSDVMDDEIDWLEAHTDEESDYEDFDYGDSYFDDIDDKYWQDE